MALGNGLMFLSLLFIFLKRMKHGAKNLEFGFSWECSAFRYTVVKKMTIILNDLTPSTSIIKDHITPDEKSHDH